MGFRHGPTGPVRMATTTANRLAGPGRNLTSPLGSAATAAMLAVVGLAITIKFPSATPLAAVAVAGILVLTAWMLLSERYEWSLVVVMLYIGLADGYLKLSTGSSHITLVRDLLMYSVVVGALVRLAVRREALRWPPLSGWIVAWTVVVLVQIANPADGTLQHSFASVRPHLEWVPLFFFGYAVMRSKGRIRAFLYLLVAIAAINGVVGLVQLNLSKEQLAAWGPGYEKAINGEGENEVSGRGFTDENGEEHNRPFALGGDSGFGGILGMFAVPAALALLVLTRRPGSRALVALLSAGTILAVATSASRTAVLGSIIAVFAFAGLTVTSRAGLRTVLALALALFVAYGTITLLNSSAHQGSFDRYNSIKNPGEAISTAYNYRSSTLAKVPTYIGQIPFGGGIGSAGPAGSYAGGNEIKRDAESEPTFLVIELGFPGLVVMYGLVFTMFYLSITRIRRIVDYETRILLTGVAAPLFANFLTGLAGINSANVPPAPYLWFSAGILSFWLLAKNGPLQASDRPGSTRRPEPTMIAA
jgi:hypothetical protein